MSKSYENLTDAEKLLKSTHFPGKTGPRLERLLMALQHQLDNLILDGSVFARKGFQLSTALGSDLGNVGEYLDLARFASESDDDLRSRVETAAVTFETVTKDAILDLFDELIGKRPYFQESFHTRLYRSGDVVGPSDGGKFALMFELPITIKSENLRVASGGTSVIVTDDGIEEPYNTSLSTNVNTTTTTIEVSSIASFQTSGELIIDSEWVSYGTTQTSPAAFVGCNRGLYDSDPATHSTDATVTEGCNKAFLEGTNQQVYGSQSGTTMFLTGSYDWDTYFDVQYRIAEASVKDEFDTQEELGAALTHLRAIGFDYKAAGIKADISVGMALRSWFQASREVIVISDLLDFFADILPIALDESLVFVPPDRSVFYESAWDDANRPWDVCLWSLAYWDGYEWKRQGGDKDWYRLEINAHT